jgi:hypothetical protein
MREESRNKSQNKKESVGGRKSQRVREVYPANFVYKGLYGEIEILSKQEQHTTQS